MRRYLIERKIPHVGDAPADAMKQVANKVSEIRSVLDAMAAE